MGHAVEDDKVEKGDAYHLTGTLSNIATMAAVRFYIVKLERMQHGPPVEVQKFILELILQRSEHAPDRKANGLKVADIRAADGIIISPDDNYKLMINAIQARLSALRHVDSPPVCAPGSAAPLNPKPVFDIRDQLAGLKEKIFPKDVSGLAAADAKGTAAFKRLRLPPVSTADRCLVRRFLSTQRTRTMRLKMITSAR
jgi:hypothetical protein